MLRRGNQKNNGKPNSAITRPVARIIFSTLKKIGNSRGVTLKKIYDYIKTEYPNSSSNIIKLSNIMKKALAFGAVNKKHGNKYVLGSIIKTMERSPKKGFSIVEARRRRRKRRGKKRRRSSMRECANKNAV
ncbi:uncharacterized protein LOC126734012 [Anthonomus grandis grandis]|uniref:uncharacterized protein LOC126734012 n=1 Tax=Anthonomus grandis grandis TaxID=2921223 RepID=UPI0021656F2F|nr:uncharacterized protein LOC126734012 [Anthonomus grandis grandis]